MNKRIDIIMADGTRRKGYATTEHAASSYGNPVVVIDDIPHGPGDLAIQGAKVVTTDADTATALIDAGYTTVASTYKRTSVVMSDDTLAALKVKAGAEGLTVSGAVDLAVREWLERNGG